MCMAVRPKMSYKHVYGCAPQVAAAAAGVGATRNAISVPEDHCPGSRRAITVPGNQTVALLKSASPQCKYS